VGSASGHWVNRTGRLQAARAFIENNLEWGGLNPANAARALGISVRQLHLLFEPTGTTFSRYVLARRLERARLALADGTRRKVLDIAFSCGIESSTVFYRAFRDAYGMNPTGYRRSLREREVARAAYSGTAEPRPEAVPLG
jgi:AraC-like DNA-binding protein